LAAPASFQEKFSRKAGLGGARPLLTRATHQRSKSSFAKQITETRDCTIKSTRPEHLPTIKLNRPPKLRSVNQQHQHLSVADRGTSSSDSSTLAQPTRHNEFVGQVDYPTPIDYPILLVFLYNNVGESESEKYI
jgi:hypothetical protein